MWQVMLGIYFIVVILVTVLLWSSLVLAKRSDRNGNEHVQPIMDRTLSDEFNAISQQALKIPTLSELSKK